MTLFRAVRVVIVDTEDKGKAAGVIRRPRESWLPTVKEVLSSLQQLTSVNANRTTAGYV